MGRILTIGSINADHIYRVPRLPAPGETLSVESFSRTLGGKGANQSVAAARSGAPVRHVGAVGADGGWLVERLGADGIETDAIARVEVPTGHAIVAVDSAGENAILIFAGANAAVPEAAALESIAGYGAGDLCLLQNEINLGPDIAAAARAQGMTVIYTAAPFDAARVAAMLPHVDLVVMNAVEAKQLGTDPWDLPCDALVTRGAEGARWFGDSVIERGAFAVNPVDTTGAGDCYLGALAAQLAAGSSKAEAMRWAAAAAAIQVTRPGTADAMPTRDEIADFLADRP